MNTMQTLNTVVTMSSREIAELTGKRHDHVMRDIRNMIIELCGEEGLPTFGGSYINSQNKEQPCFNLPKRETLILVSGYSIELRARIIDRWQELEGQTTKSLSLGEFLVQQAQMLLEIERKQQRLEAEQKQQNLRLQSVEARIDASTGYTTVKAFCKMHTIPCPLRLAKVYGKDLSAMCREQDLIIGRVSDEVYGQVNSYPISLMLEYFELG